MEFVKSLTGAPLVVTSDYMMTDSEAVTKGEALKFASGRLTKVTNGDTVAAIAQETKAAGTNVTVKVALVTANQVWRAKYTGTPDATFVVGCNSADIAANGIDINAADVTGGAFSVLDKNTTNTTVDVMIKGRQLS